MNDAERYSVSLILETLGRNSAFRRIDDSLYVVKQGSAFVMIHVSPLEGERAVVRCAAQLVQGAQITGGLAIELLRLNAILRFGAFAYAADDDMIFFLHSILGGPTLDPDELLATVRDVAIVADHYDDRIVEKYGGKRMQDLLEEGALARVLASEADAFAKPPEGKRP
ncbi:MAG: YbjN domain-containing protein [Myxococcota bacterium]